MDSKKNPVTDGLEDIKKSIAVLAEDVVNCKLQQQQLLELLLEERNRQLARNERKNKKLAELERRADEQEQLARFNNLVIPGLNVPDEEDKGSPEQHGEARRPLPRRRESDKQTNIQRAENRKHKIALVKQGKKLKGTDV